MSAQITKFYPKNAAEKPDAVLEQAVGKYDSVVVVGWNNDGLLDLRASTNLDIADVHWIMAQANQKLLSGDYSQDGDS